jgi:CheY-like chemotaxis protein
LLVGDGDHEDFLEATAWLAEHTQLRRVKTAEEGRNCLAEGPWPEAVVIAQSRPGQFSSRQIESLHAASPLSRLVALLGSWCEGEMRSGKPWPGVIRVLWHQWQPRLIPPLAPDSAPHCTLWELPRTAPVAEQYAAAADVAWPKRDGLVAIHAPTVHNYEQVRDVCRQAGYSTLWLPPNQTVHASHVAAAIWDGVACDEIGDPQLRAVVAQHRPAPVIAMLDYVRRQDYERARSAGAAAVIAKPFLVYDLLWHLETHVSHAAESRTSCRPA